jgi:hypothetical protein
MTLRQRVFVVALTVMMVAPACDLHEGQFLAQDSQEGKAIFSQAMLEEGYEFILNSQKPPDINEFNPVGEYILTRFPVYAETLQKKGDDKLWESSDTRVVYVIFYTRNYIHKTKPLRLFTYSLKEGEKYRVMGMLYRNMHFAQERAVARTAVLIGDTWHVNKHLFDKAKRETDIRPSEILYVKDGDTTPVSIELKFDSLEGEKTIVIEISKMPASLAGQKRTA